MSAPTIILTIPDAAWEGMDGGKGRTRLLATVDINGVPFHFEAIRVQRVNWGATGISIDGCERLALIEATDLEAKFMTMKIGRYPYIVWATPFSE
jgi:hypothetical protein